LKNKIPVLLIATIASFIVPFTISSVVIAIPTISKEFSMAASEVGWIPTAYLLAAAMFLVPFGKIADLYGRKKIFLAGMLVYTVASLLLAFSNSGLMFILARALQGVGGSMTAGTSIAMLISVYEPKERGFVLGITISAVYIGLSLGPVIGGFLVNAFGWRSIFLVNVPLGLIVILLTLILLKGQEWAFSDGKKFDIWGSFIYCLMLPLFIYGFSVITTGKGVFFAAAGFAALIMFVKWELRSENPVLDLRLFKHNLTFRYSSLATLINYSAASATTYLLSLYLQYIKAIGPKEAGLILMSQPVVQAIFSPMAGKLSDKVEPRIIASIGMGLTCIGLFIFSFISENTALPLLIANLMLMGFGFALFSSPNTNAVMGSVGKESYGVASAIVSTLRVTGQMASMSVAMLVFSVIIGNMKIIPAAYPALLKSMKILFMIFSVFSLAGVFASLARGKLHKAAPEKS